MRRRGSKRERERERERETEEEDWTNEKFGAIIQTQKNLISISPHSKSTEKKKQRKEEEEKPPCHVAVRPRGSHPTWQSSSPLFLPRRHCIGSDHLAGGHVASCPRDTLRD